MSWKIGYVPRSKEAMERPGSKRQRLYNGTGKRSKLRRRKQRVQRLEFQKRSLSICFCLFVFSLISFFPFLKIKIYIYIMKGNTYAWCWMNRNEGLSGTIHVTIWLIWTVHSGDGECCMCVLRSRCHPCNHSILAVKVDAVRNYREFVIFFQR